MIWIRQNSTIRHGMIWVKRSFMKKYIVVLCVFISGTLSAAIGPGHVVGKISNITSVGSGILVRIGSNEVPQNCTSGLVWMEIKQTDTAITALTLTAWTLGRSVVVYTSPGTSGYCRVTQLDPNES